jgi:alanine-glyoxylate transaminase/serine-glyoxylate transaminase/serine-pyruvate transaminase
VQIPLRASTQWEIVADTARVPAGIDEAAVRQRLLREFNIEIGSGLGPLAGKIWRVGLMGASSTRPLLLLFLGALEHILHGMGHKSPGGAATAAMDALPEGVTA